MAPLDCPEIKYLRALLDDLSPDHLSRLEQHVQSCRTCQVHLDRSLEGEEEFREWAGRVGDPTLAPADPTLADFLRRMHSQEAPGIAPSDEPPDLYFLIPDDRPDVLGTLGGYDVLAVIGHGGMGVVLKAFEPALNRMVAIKVPAAAIAGSATARRRFTREAKAAAAVCHDHIVAVHGVHEADGLPFLVMQHVAGESLQERLSRTGPLETEEVVRIGLETASGLAAAHAQGLIHRDIKPANLLLEGDEGRVKITDFGLARMADDVHLTQAGVAAGTPEYMAPEQARGESADHRSDLFSLGSVLYACCTGRAPFHGPTPLALLHAVNDREPTPPRSLNSAVPAWLEEIIVRLMAKDLAQRFQSAVEISALLEAGLAHIRRPDLRPAPPTVAVGRTRSSRRVTALLLAATLAALAGGLTLLMFQGVAPEGKSADPYVVWSVAVSPDGKTLAAGAGWWTSTGEVGVWDLATRKPLRRFTDERGVGSVAFSPDGKHLAHGGWTGRTRVLDWAAGNQVADFETGGLTHVAFSPTGGLLATASEGQYLQLFDTASWQMLANLDGDLLRFHRVTFSPDGKRLLAGGGDWKRGGVNHVGVWDVAGRKQVQKLAGHNNTVFCLACSPDGKTVATGSVDHTIRLYDAETGELRKVLGGLKCPVDGVVFTSDSKFLLSCGPEPVIRFWDLEQGKETRQLNTGISHVRALHLTPDQKLLIVGGQQKTLKILDAGTGEELTVLWSEAGPEKREMDQLPASVPESGRSPGRMRPSKSSPCASARS